MKRLIPILFFFLSLWGGPLALAVVVYPFNSPIDARITALPFIDARRFGPKADLQTGTDGVIASTGSSSFTSASTTFTTATVGKRILIQNESVDPGPTTDVVATVTGYVSAHVIVLSVPMVAGSGKSFWVGSDDAVALQAGLNAVPTGGTLIIPPGNYLTSDALTPKANTAVNFNGATITQISAQKAVFKCDLRDNVTIEGAGGLLYCPLTRVFTTGNSYGDQNNHLSAGVWSNSSNTTVRNVTVQNFWSGVFLSDQQAASTSLSPLQVVTQPHDNRVEHLTVSGVDWGILGWGQRGLVIDGISGSYGLTSGSGDPSHLVYLSGGLGSPQYVNTGVTLAHAYALNGRDGAAFTFKNVEILHAGDLKADGCPAILNLASYVQYVDIDGLIDRNDTGGSNGGVFMANGTNINHIRLNNVDVEMASGDSATAAKLFGTDAVITHSRFVLNRPTAGASSLYAVRLLGTGITLNDVTILEAGAGYGRAIQVDSTASNAVINGITASHVSRVVDTIAGSTNTHVTYNPNEITMLAGSSPVSVAGTGDLVTLIGEKTETLASITTPSSIVHPNLGSATRHIIPIGTTGLVTISNPNGAGADGLSSTYEIQNNSGGTSNIAFSSFYTLAHPIVQPANGSSVVYKFRYDSVTNKMVEQNPFERYPLNQYDPTGQTAGTSPESDGIGGLTWQPQAHLDSTGTVGTIPKFTSITGFGNSIITESSGLITVGGRLSANGPIGQGGITSTAAVTVMGSGGITNTGAQTFGILSGPIIPATSTTSFYNIVSNAPSLSGDVAILGHFRAINAALNGHALGMQIGYYVPDLTGATSNYGVYTDITSGSGKWSYYAAGNANSAFAGSISVGQASVPSATLDVSGTGKFSTSVSSPSLIASGANLLTIEGATSTNPTKMTASGVDTSVGIDFFNKGSGLFRFRGGSDTRVAALSTGTASATVTGFEMLDGTGTFKGGLFIANNNKNTVQLYSSITSLLELTGTDLKLTQLAGSASATSKYLGTDASGNIVFKTDPVTSETDPLSVHTEADPLSLHTSGGAMTGTITSRDLAPSTAHTYGLGSASFPYATAYSDKFFATPSGSTDAAFLAQLQSGATLPYFYGTKAGGTASEEFYVSYQGNVNMGYDLQLRKASLNAVDILMGTGSPNSAVTANIGSIFLRTDGGAGTTLYVKESGTATNTGWVAK